MRRVPVSDAKTTVIPLRGLDGGRSGKVPASSATTTAIPLVLPSLQAKALALFVKRVDFETVARMSAVTVVSDGKSEADLIWLALGELRGALAAADVKPR